MRRETRTPSKNPPGRWQAAPSGIAGSDVFRAQACRFVYPLVPWKKQAESCVPLAERWDSGDATSIRPVAATLKFGESVHVHVGPAGFR